MENCHKFLLMLRKLRMINNYLKKGKETYNLHHKNLIYHIEKEKNQIE